VIIKGLNLRYSEFRNPLPISFLAKASTLKHAVLSVFLKNGILFSLTLAGCLTYFARNLSAI
jgi:hypothetical protein